MCSAKHHWGVSSARVPMLVNVFVTEDYAYME
jgi:hypothetical protein